MISIKLSAWAEKNGKNISQIAKETGLNRNTVTALWHGKVDGIRFDTISIFNKTYGLEVSDLIEIRNIENKQAGERVYRQEGPGRLLSLWPAAKAFNNMPTSYFSMNFGRAYLFVKDDYFYWYYNSDNAKKIARYCYERYADEQEFGKLQARFLAACSVIEDLYDSRSESGLLAMDNNELRDYFRNVSTAYDKFWQYSIFIDSFDTGFDSEKTNELAKEHGFELPEIEILACPEEKGPDSHRTIDLLRMAERIKAKKIPKRNLKEYVQGFILNDDEAQEYRRKYDYLNSTYADADGLSEKELASELYEILGDWSRQVKRCVELEEYEARQAASKEKILRKYHLRDNPFHFFAKLSSWREVRKATNQMGFSVVGSLLGVLAIKTGIPVELLGYLNFDELNFALNGLITAQTLQKRKDEGIITIFEKEDYKSVQGEEAVALERELRANRGLSDSAGTRSVSGITASQGYAKGRARIIRNTKDIAKFKAGEILVMGVNRQEFVPLLQKAAGILTNEGGLTSIVASKARELRKPCIIGTDDATEVFKDGDTVEIRATHGTARKIEI